MKSLTIGQAFFLSLSSIVPQESICYACRLFAVPFIGFAEL